jgi:hypothetical protein
MFFNLPDYFAVAAETGLDHPVNLEFPDDSIYDKMTDFD